MKTTNFFKGFILLGLLSIFSIGYAATDNAKFTPKQTKAIEKIVHDYLLKNPKVLMEVSAVLQKQQRAEEEKDAQSAIKQNSKQLFSDPATPYIGNADPKVIMVEFFDYQCGHCKKMRSTVQAILKKNKNLKIVFKELPIFGASSRTAAKAALASAKQNKYYQFHEALLNAKGALNEDKIMKIAKGVGIDTAKLKKDMESKAVDQALKDNFQLAEKLKLRGTPAFIFTNKHFTKFDMVPGSAQQSALQHSIDSVIKSNS